MSTEKGWTHRDMMGMPWRLLLRYYGYWYQDLLREADAYEEREWKNRQEEELRGREPDWKPL